MPIPPSAQQVAPRRSERLLRPLLAPFVEAGWGLAKVADFGGSTSVAATFGPWVKGMLPFCVAVFCLLVLPLLPLAVGASSGLNDAAAAMITLLLLPVTLLAGILNLAGMMRGTYFAMHGVTRKQLMRRHRSDPISTRRILVTCLISAIALACFALWMQFSRALNSSWH